MCIYLIGTTGKSIKQSLYTENYNLFEAILQEKMEVEMRGFWLMSAAAIAFQ